MVKLKEMLEWASKSLSRIDVRLQAFKRAAVTIVCLAMYIMAEAQKGAAGFSQATSEITTYKEPVKQLMYAIAAVIALVGAFNIYFKMQNGDQDVKKTIMMTIGGCVAFVAAATALPAFFE